MASPNFSGTITGGIQDISALLPLLGTEQCEKHVGSALDRGFLYSSATPISIFGSLGIVRAAFNILIASLSIPRFQFLGAKKLNDGGFAPSGIVAPMIALDPVNPRRFLAESRLEVMLADEHIENVEDLTVSTGTGIIWWNSWLVLSTMIIAAAGLLPYIVIIRHSPHSLGKFVFSSGWGFPVCRVAGSVLCVNTAQFLIEIRILVILKTRLLFLTVDRLAKEKDIDLNSLINKDIQRNLEEGNTEIWGADIASEKCIWVLERWMQLPQSKHEPTKVAKSFVDEIFDSEHTRQLQSINNAIPPWITLFFCSVLVVGIVLSIGGYIGCFYLIQHSTNDTFGPLAWLILEALLSVIRILIWALNPACDDSKGIVFQLQLASHAPLVTCNKSQFGIEEDGVAPVTRADSFLEDVVAYTGPLPLFNVDDVSLYYILTAAQDAQDAISTMNGNNNPFSPGPRSPRAMLYIVISAYKEQTSRILLKKDDRASSFSIYISKLEPIPGSTAINVEADFSDTGLTEEKTHFFTANPRFMDQLKSHYNEILAKLKHQESNKDRKDSFGKTWAMQHSHLRNEQRTAENTTQSSPANDTPFFSLTKEDMKYLYQGQVERRWRLMHRQLEEWIGLYIDLYAQELFEDVPINRAFKETKPLDIIHMYEVNEVEYLIIECRVYMERLLMQTASKWSELVKEHHVVMINAVLQDTFVQVPGDTAQKRSSSTTQHGEEIRKGQLKDRLEDEGKSLFHAELRLRTENRYHRAREQADATENRIRDRKYNDSTGEKITAAWKEVIAAVKKNGEVILRHYDQFKKEIEARLLAAREDNRLKDKTAKTSVDKHFEHMKRRCLQRANQLFKRMDDQRAEFEELRSGDVLQTDPRNLKAFWSHESLQERLRLLRRKHKFLHVSDTSTEAVGGWENMARALSRSQDFAFVDMSQSSLDPENIHSIIMGDKLITGLAYPWQYRDEDRIDILKSAKTIPRVKEALEAKKDITLYGDGFVTEGYRKGHPYLLFDEPGNTVCMVYFRVLEKRDHLITLRHCMTTSNGRIDISLNNNRLPRTWGLSNEVKDNFENENIFLPKEFLKDDDQPNILQVILGYDSEGVYWLSDVSLPVCPAETPSEMT